MSEQPSALFVCRSCGAPKLEEVLSLGRMPLANALLKAEQLDAPEETYPLNLVFCPTCTLLQITETVPPEKLFREYFYLSSTSETMLQHANEIATRTYKIRGLNEQSLVIEVGSNDGYLLQYYKKAGIPVLGIEPARNVARIAQTQRDITTVCEFFGADLAAHLLAKGQAADVIHANNVLAHVPDLNGFVCGLELALKDNGVIMIEVPYLIHIIERCEFDTIYHEHLCYFSLTALDHLFRRHGLVIHEAEQLDIHGGTLRVCAQKEIRPSAKIHPGGTDPTVQRLLDEEFRQGAANLEFFSGFKTRVEELGCRLKELLRELKAKGQRIAAYGASAKGSTLLNYFGLDGGIIDYVVDRSELKRGYFTPGTHLPICGLERLVQDMPDYVLLLAWTYADEILDQQKEYRARGGRFVIPIPELHIV